MTKHATRKRELRATLVGVRLSEVDLQCLRVLEDYAKAEAPGQNVTRADVIRRCIHKCRQLSITNSR